MGYLVVADVNNKMQTIDTDDLYPAMMEQNLPIIGLSIDQITECARLFMTLDAEITEQTIDRMITLLNKVKL